MDMVTVKSNLGKTSTGGFPVAIHHKSDEYKEDKNDSALMDGELFIADDKVHKVPMTGEVMRALSENRLVRAEKGEKAGDTFEPELAAGEVREVTEVDTVETLVTQNSREQLNAMAKKAGIDNPEAFTNKEEVAKALIDSRE